MQILINLNSKNVVREGKTYDEVDLLYEVLLKLQEEGYYINNKVGDLIYDFKKKKAINVNETKETLPLSYEIIKKMFKMELKLALISTDTKYVTFTESFSLAIHFCNNRKIRPLDTITIIDNFEELFKNENEPLLNTLYEQSFVNVWGDVPAQPTLFNPKDKHFMKKVIQMFKRKK